MSGSIYDAYFELFIIKLNYHCFSFCLLVLEEIGVSFINSKTFN